jgi:hypothetical protein
MSRLSDKELIVYSEAIDALRKEKYLHERMETVSSHNLFFKCGSDLVGVYFTPYEIIIAANGSNTFIEWLSNLRIFRTRTGFHKGFYCVAEKVFEKLLEYDHIINSNKPITFTGHSRGAYIQITNALFNGIKSPNRETKCVTFGSPRMMSRRGIRFLKAAGVFLHRVFSKGDRVDDIIPRFLGYKHYDNEIYEIGAMPGKLDHLSYTAILKRDSSCLKKLTKM